MAIIKCSVANCFYYEEGNMCTADAIMVDVDKHANAQFDQEIGEVGVDSNHQDYAANKRDTLCHTFKSREE